MVVSGFVRSFFFFQAEDGIRDRTVTGVQTCARPIWLPTSMAAASPTMASSPGMSPAASACMACGARSEERRVGKECRSWWWAYHLKKKNLKYITYYRLHYKRQWRRCYFIFH